MPPSPMARLASLCPLWRLALGLFLLPAAHARVLPPLFSPVSAPNLAPLPPPTPQPTLTVASAPALPGMDIVADHHHGHHLSKQSVLKVSLVSFGIALVFFFILFAWIYRKKHGERVESKGTSTTGSVQGHPLGTTSIKFNSMKSNKGSVPNLEYALLESATGSFSEDNIVGEGAFGCVYKARLEGGLVAVKKIDQGRQDYDKEFENEIDMLSRIRHSNIITLMGTCTQGQNRFLVYEFMQNGSLEDQLHGPSHATSLTWYIRMKIALDIARGLEFLHEHCSPPVIHRDLKSSNILLNSSFTAKISDFGLAVSGANQSKTTAKLSGTLGYVAPEYLLDGKLSEKSDVYAFGVVLLELLLGRKPVEKMAPSQCQSIVTWAMPQLTDREKLPNIIDPAIKNTMDLKHLYQVAAVAVLCVQPEPSYRPLITDVLHSLIPLVPVDLGGTLKATESSCHANQTPSHPT